MKLTIVGDAPPPAVQALAGDGVEVTGWVPEIEPYLASHRLSVAPLRFGAGMKGKVGEALAAGLPVVTTTIGAEGMVDGDPAGSRPRRRRRPAGVRRRDRPPRARRRRVVERWPRPAARTSRGTTATRRSPRRSSGCSPPRRRSPVVPGLTSIVILAHGERDLTEACLASIERHTPEPHEVILVDNGSPDDSPRSSSATRPSTTTSASCSTAATPASPPAATSASRSRAATRCCCSTTTRSSRRAGSAACARRSTPSAVGATGPRSNNVSGPQKIADTAYGDPYADPARLDAFAAAQAAAHAGETAAAPRVVGFCLLARRERSSASAGSRSASAPATSRTTTSACASRPPATARASCSTRSCTTRAAARSRPRRSTGRAR